MMVPDGGWGWAIVLAVSIKNILTIPMTQVFGLIFGDKLHNIGLTATDVSVITNTNQAFGLLLGLFNGALLKQLGYRKVAFASAFFIFIGCFMSAFANSFRAFLLTYGIIYSTGTGMAKSAYTLALNTYFSKKRNKATALALTLSALGPILLPLLVPILLNSYGLQGTVIILSAILGHVFVSASLLQPVEKHVISVEDTEKENLDNVVKSNKQIAKSRKTSNTQNLMEQPMSRDRKLSFYDLGSIDDLEFIDRSTLSLYTERKEGKEKIKFSNRMYSSLVSVSEDNTFEKSPLVIMNGVSKIETDHTPSSDNLQEQKNKLLDFFINICKIFELSLLIDPIFVNIVVGVSLGIFAELNFAILTALMLSDFGLDKSQIATFISVRSTAELIFRFASPYIGGCLNDSPRVLYMISAVLLSLSRFFFIWVEGFQFMLISAVLMGMFGGLRAVYTILVIPCNVPLEKLAGASGIQMVLNGIMFLVGGPILGFVKDFTGTYRKCVVVINCITLLSVILWGVEMLMKKVKDRKNRDKKRKIIVM